MDNLNLSSYIQQARKSGMGDDKIREGLLRVGKSEFDITEALKSSVRPTEVLSKPKWHPTKAQKMIAIVGTILIIILALGYAYTSYLASKNYNEIIRQAKLAQEVTQALEQKRAESPSNSSWQFEVTSTWKTYRNEEYGFEFKYPGDLIPKEASITSELLNISFSTRELYSEPRGASFYITVDLMEEIKPLDQWVKRFGIDGNASEIKVNNYNFVKWFEYMGEDMKGPSHFSTLLKNNYVLTFSIGYQADTDQILSTFRFT